MRPGIAASRLVVQTFPRVFVDTNIWVYAHLHAPGDNRHPLALKRLALEADKVISPQVVAEHYSVMLRNGQSDAWIQANLQAIFDATGLQPADASLVATALSLRQRYGFSFWDCQIAATTLVAGCEVLLSEDLQHGQVLDDGLTVINLFHDADSGN